MISIAAARMLIPFAMGVVTSFPFPKVSSPESKPIGVGLPEASQGDVRSATIQQLSLAIMWIVVAMHPAYYLIAYCFYLLFADGKLLPFMKTDLRWGEVTAAKGFNAGGMYDGLRASKEKPDLGIVTCDADAVPADN
ncbi:hypothetical protein F2Q69_00059253 [Brassica cretica]|uniref:Uncharacterized protein n=1 Tax=Brassica cretica TaxID=69181 RepID=A0A8S9RFX7_BRACR|nr:hypothetical protein F2Q69_00059253 [Brassica cretica]